MQAYFVCANSPDAAPGLTQTLLFAAHVDNRNRRKRPIRLSSAPIISPQTSYRLANRKYDGGAKDSGKQELPLCRSETTTKRSQRQECGQLSQPWVRPWRFHLAVRVCLL